MWRNWQTRMVQVHVKAISWGFKSLHPHQKLVERRAFLLSCGLFIQIKSLVSEETRLFLFFVNGYTANVFYQIYGISRYLTFLQYAVYPCNCSFKSISSFRIRLYSNMGYTKNTTNDIQEPSTSGMARNISNVAEYMGWRITPYRPVLTTVCPSRTSTVRDRYAFSRSTSANIKYPSKNTIAAATESHLGIAVQWYRWSNPAKMKILN